MSGRKMDLNGPQSLAESRFDRCFSNYCGMTILNDYSRFPNIEGLANRVLDEVKRIYNEMPDDLENAKIQVDTLVNLFDEHLAKGEELGKGIEQSRIDEAQAKVAAVAGKES